MVRRTHRVLKGVALVVVLWLATACGANSANSDSTSSAPAAPPTPPAAWNAMAEASRIAQAVECINQLPPRLMPAMPIVGYNEPYVEVLCQGDGRDTPFGVYRASGFSIFNSNVARDWYLANAPDRKGGGKLTLMQLRLVGDRFVVVPVPSLNRRGFDEAAAQYHMEVK